MSNVAFYHLQYLPLERALPKLLEKTLEAGKRALVLANSSERIEVLAGLLWTYEPNSWLPHGTSRDGCAEEQPIWLSTKDANPNGSTFLFLTDGAWSVHIEDFERCFDLFDGNDVQAVEAARKRWTAAQADGHKLTYWQQTTQGAWERKV